MNNIKKCLIIKSPEFINPFLAYSLFWALSFLVYFLSPSKLVQNISIPLVVFCIITIFISLLFAIDFNNHFKNSKIYFKYSSPLLLTCGLLFVYILEFIYSKNIPLLSAFLSNNQSGYDNFGIPTLHVIIFTFSTLFCIKNYIDFLVFRKKINIFSIITIFVFFLMVFSRGVLLMLVLCFTCIYLCTKPISLSKLLIFFVFGVFVMYLFGVLGNIRVSGKWNDSSAILNISQIEADPNGIFTPFVWAEEYICCSLRNLNYTIFNVNPSFSIREIIYAVIPDFISKRIVGNVEFATQRASFAYTTTTTFGDIYTCLGYFGMMIEFLFYIVIGLIITKICYINNSYKIATFAICFFIFALSIFSPSIQYSGYSFSLIWGVLCGIFSLKINKGETVLIRKN